MNLKDQIQKLKEEVACLKQENKLFEVELQNVKSRDKLNETNSNEIKVNKIIYIFFSFNSCEFFRI